MEEIIIKDKLLGTQHFAYPVGEFLCAVGFREGYKIYKLKQRRPFIGTMFKTLDDCLSAIKVFYEIYGEYLPIWENPDWVDADVPALFQWTVKNGVNIYEFIQKIEQDGAVIRCSSLHEVMT